MLSYLKIPITWLELAKRTFREVLKNDAQGLAAQLSYYFFLALFPALLCLIAIASFFPLHHFTDDVSRLLGPVAPAEVINVIREQMVKISEGRNGGLLSLGFLGAIWSSSGAMVAVVGAMNRAYDISEGRPWWKVRVVAVSLTIALALLIVLAFTLVVAGPEIADSLAKHFFFGSVFVWTWKVVQWPLAFALVVTGIGSIYYFGPDAEQEWIWITPGSLVATVLWLVGSLIFRFYAVHFGNYQATYGAIGGIILLLLWFYMSGLVIVIGAEMSAEIEHASPWAKAPGEKRPGERKKIGLAAAREFEHGAAVRAPSGPRPAAVLTPLGQKLRPTFVERVAGVVTLAIRFRRRGRP